MKAVVLSFPQQIACLQIIIHTDEELILGSDKNIVNTKISEDKYINQ